MTVEGAGEDLLEKTSTFHTDVDRDLFDKMPLESRSSSVSSLVTLSSPGIAADSNGLFHGLGDHAENSFSVDGQPITDQQSKVFSNQIPLDSIESMEVISGAPPAEFGEKTSVVINVTTRSGQGMTTPKGSVTASYGSFGTADLGINFGYGGQKWGNFISASGLNSGRFLDPPEFAVMHDKGNEENIFDRVDFQLSQADSIHVNLGFTRSWFQTPNAFDNLNVRRSRMAIRWARPTSARRSRPSTSRRRGRVRSIPTRCSRWAPSCGATSTTTIPATILLLTSAPSSRRPSPEPDADQRRTALGSLLRKGHSQHESWEPPISRLFWTRTPDFGIVDPLLNAPCLDANGRVPVAGLQQSFAIASAPNQPNVASNPNATTPFLPLLGCYDLTRPTPAPADGCAGSTSSLFPFLGHTDVKQLALYAQDTITKGSWSLNLGLRGDFYNGLTTHREAEPRLGVAYNVKKTNTVLRVSYARVLETPFNENLVLASTGCNSAGPVFAAGLCRVRTWPLRSAPGWRNEFHAGLQQAFGKYVVFSGEYIWKYTHNAYDFSVLGSTPITFPIEWHNSKIPGFAGRVSVPDFHGFSALMVFSSVAARFFTPQIGGAGAVPSGTVGQGVHPVPHRPRRELQPDHARPVSALEARSMARLQWRYDSGLVAGEVPVADASGTVDLSGLTGDQQLQAGLFCGSCTPTLTQPLGVCTAGYGSTLISLPAPGKENDDTNPPRVAPAQSVRSRGGRRQSFPRRTLQMEPSPYRHQCDQQSRAVQLPVNVQRHALRYAAGADSRVGFHF